MVQTVTLFVVCKVSNVNTQNTFHKTYANVLGHGDCGLSHAARLRNLNSLFKFSSVRSPAIHFFSIIYIMALVFVMMFSY